MLKSKEGPTSYYPCNFSYLSNTLRGTLPDRKQFTCYSVIPDAICSMVPGIYSTSKLDDWVNACMHACMLGKTFCPHIAWATRGPRFETHILKAGYKTPSSLILIPLWQPPTPSDQAFISGYQMPFAHWSKAVGKGGRVQLCLILPTPFLLLAAHPRGYYVFTDSAQSRLQPLLLGPCRHLVCLKGQSLALEPAFSISLSPGKG